MLLIISSITYSQSEVNYQSGVGQGADISADQVIINGTFSGEGAFKKIKKKYFDASHHPYAFRIGVNKDKFRISDDGEPAGSSGKPILEAIDKYKVTDVVVVVTRYFRGTKLGVGVLRRAYFDVLIYV